MSPRKLVGTATDRALAAMLTENTGTHFMDSGGAYGRHWQRNAGATVEGWLSGPEAIAEAWSPKPVEGEPDTVESDDGYVVLSLFHYLRARLEYDHADTLRLLGNAARWDNQWWLQDMEQWAEQEHDRNGYGDGYWGIGSDNSYNHENSLSQDIQFYTYTSKRHGGHMVALQIHGGADARGGYTKPRVFHVTTDEPYDLFDWGKWSFGHHLEVPVEGTLPGMAEVRPSGAYRHVESGVWVVPHTWEREGNSGNAWTDHDGAFVELPDLRWRRTGEGPWQPVCPECGAVCEVWAPTT